MLDEREVTQAKGAKLVGQDGDKIGKIDDIYVDEQTGRPEWALVNTGLFGLKSNFVPLREATRSDGELQVPYTKDDVKDAPGVDPDGALSPSEEEQLYRHYQMEYGAPADVDTVADTAGAGTAAGERPAGHDTSGPETDRAMTRSEEELRVGTRERETGQVRLRKHVDTERVEEDVPVQREEVRIEREPVTDSDVDEATDGPALSEEEHEVTLHEEEAVAEKRTVPKERVQAQKDVHTDTEHVSEEVGKERIEVDEDTSRR